MTLITFLRVWCLASRVSGMVLCRWFALLLIWYRSDDVGDSLAKYEEVYCFLYVFSYNKIRKKAEKRRIMFTPRTLFFIYTQTHTHTRTRSTHTHIHTYAYIHKQTYLHTCVCLYKYKSNNIQCVIMLFINFCRDISLQYKNNMARSHNTIRYGDNGSITIGKRKALVLSKT